MSEATNISPSPRPTTSGEAPLRAKIRRSGASDEITPSAKAPSTSRQRAAHRSDEIALVVALDEVREHLGVGLAAKRVPFADQLGAQRGVVLDDPVVDDGDLRRAVQMRVRVLIGGPAVRRPARVADADRCRAAARRWPAARPTASSLPSAFEPTKLPRASMTAMPAES